MIKALHSDPATVSIIVTRYIPGGWGGTPKCAQYVFNLTLIELKKANIYATHVRTERFNKKGVFRLEITEYPLYLIQFTPFMVLMKRTRRILER